MHDVTDVSVIGAGAMGHGLALHCSLEGADVTLVDHRQANLDTARDHIDEAVDFLARKGLTDAAADETLDEITFTLDLEAGLSDAALVVETIAEDIDAKRELFRTLSAAAPDDALLTSNTSSLSIDAIAEAVPDDADRVAGCHWWYPPYLLRPVEVVRGTQSSDETIDHLCAFVEAVDRDPILVEKDVPGFVWNRVQFAVVRECLHIVDEGIASVEDVNRAVRDGYATRTAAIGPFETMDIAGLDLFETISEGLFPHLADDDTPGESLRERVESGRTGIDVGSGFMDYDDSPETVTRRRDERVAAIQRALGAPSGDDG